MACVFADTFYWIALTYLRDQSHDKAVALSRELHTAHLVTTENVLVEFLNYSSERGPHSRRAATDLARQILVDPAVQVFPQHHDTFLTGLELYKSRPDKGYSLTDCISMIVMRRESITDVLTNDQHFAQEGFHCLFREDSN